MLAQVPKKPAEMVRRSHPLKELWIITKWELRRLVMSQVSWIIVGLVFLFFLFPVWANRNAAWLQNEDTKTSVNVAGTSAWGIIIILPRSVLLVLGMFLPFLAADFVTRDLRRRTHELLMSSAISSWAYVGGRYLAMLIVCLTIAIVTLASLLVMSLILTASSDTRPANLFAIISVWFVSVVPATILIGSLSFSLSTLFPRYSNILKVVVLAAWVVCAVILVPTLTGNASWPWYTYWNPAATGMSKVIDGQYQLQFYQLTGSVRSNAEALRLVRYLEQITPDLWPWLWNQLILAGIGVAIVGLAIVRFERFRSDLS